MQPNLKDLAHQTEKLRLDFLKCVVETVQTFIELTEFEISTYNGPHSREGIQHIEQGLSNIRKIAEQVSSVAERARISKQLTKLEEQAAELNQRFDAQQR